MVATSSATSISAEKKLRRCSTWRSTSNASARSTSPTLTCATRSSRCSSSTPPPAPAARSRRAWRRLGGHGAFIESKSTQIAHGDTPKEIGEIFGRYFDGIAIRHCDWELGNRYISDVAKHCRVPVLNMQCDIYHPFQCLADLMTIVEKKGKDLRRKKIVVSWAYAQSYQKPMSVPQSLVLQMPRFGLDVTLAHPPEFKLMPQIMEQAQEMARKYGTKFEMTESMEEGFKDADVVYAKSWGANVFTKDANEGARIIKKYEAWITDEKKMKLAKPDAIYMHPLPADRNIEVTDAVMDGPTRWSTTKPKIACTRRRPSWP